MAEMMDRRSFLKLMGLVTAGTALPPGWLEYEQPGHAIQATLNHVRGESVIFLGNVKHASLSHSPIQMLRPLTSFQSLTPEYPYISLELDGSIIIPFSERETWRIIISMPETDSVAAWDFGGTLASYELIHSEDGKQTNTNADIVLYDRATLTVIT